MLKPRSVVRVNAGARMSLSPDRMQLRIRTPSERCQSIPLGQIDQLQVRVLHNPELLAWVELARSARPVLLVNRKGALLAKLVVPERADDRPSWLQSLDEHIIHSEAFGYPDWLLDQQRHCVSRILMQRGRRPVPDIRHCLGVLERALRRQVKRGSVAAHMDDLGAMLHGHVDSFLVRNRLLRVKGLLGDYGYKLDADLQALLLPPALRAWVRCLRERSATSAQGLGVFVCELRASLDARASLHMKAMLSHMKSSDQNGLSEKRSWMGGPLDRYTEDD